MAAAEFNVSDEGKQDLVEQMVPQAVNAINALSTGHGLANDVVDVLANALGMMLAGDTNLDTPQKLRLGAETVAQHVLRHAKRYKAQQDTEGGETVLRQLLDSYEMPEALKKGLN